MGLVLHLIFLFPDFRIRSALTARVTFLDIRVKKYLNILELTTVHGLPAWDRWAILFIYSALKGGQGMGRILHNPLILMW